MIGSDLTIHLNDANGKLVREIKVEEANALEGLTICPATGIFE